MPFGGLVCGSSGVNLGLSRGVTRAKVVGRVRLPDENLGSSIPLLLHLLDVCSRAPFPGSMHFWFLPLCPLLSCRLGERLHFTDDATSHPALGEENPAFGEYVPSK